METGIRLHLITVTVDCELVGAWARSRLVVDGMPCVDFCQVLWLQTSDSYADIRVPQRLAEASARGPAAVFARPWAFAGVATWEPPIMTWHHHLDSMLQPNVDSNPLRRDGEMLVESGRFRWAGLWIPFRAEWRKVSRPEDVAGARVEANRIQVTIGTWRIVVEDQRPSGPFRATRYELQDQDEGWRAKGSVSEPAHRLSGLTRKRSRSSAS
jgi:hypothetical protein